MERANDKIKISSPSKRKKNVISRIIRTFWSWMPTLANHPSLFNSKKSFRNNEKYWNEMSDPRYFVY